MKIQIDEKIKNYLRFFLGIPLTLLAFIFITKFVYDSKDEVLPLFSSFDPLGVAVGLLFLVIFFLFRSLVWKEVLSQNGFETRSSVSTFLLAEAEIKRYIPGSILAFAGRMKNFDTLKIPSKSVLRMILIESVIFVIAAAILSLPALSEVLTNLGIDQTLFGIAFLLVSIVALIFLAQKTSLISESKKYYKAFLLMLIAWVFFGVGSFIAVSSFYYLPPSEISVLSSHMILSWLVGYLVIFAPLGLGAREAFLTATLSSFVPLGVAAALAIVARVVFTLAEIIFFAGSYFVYQNRHKIPKFDLAELTLYSAIVSYISYFTYVSFQKHINFFTGRFDLGNMDQTVWNTLHGNIFQLTNPDGLNNISRLAFHSDFILVLLAPFYFVWEDPRMLLLIQTVVIAAGAYFIFKIGLEVLKDRQISLILALSYLLNPFVQKQNLFDFHSVTLATTFFLAAFYFYIKKKVGLFFLFLILAALTKEQVFAIAGLFLVLVGIKTKDKKYFIYATASLIFFYLLISKFIPEARGGQHFATEYFQDFGDDPSEIIKNLVLDPARTFSALFSKENFDYLFKLFLPTGFLGLFSPIYVIISAPDLLINLISKNSNLRSLTFHYAATIIPFVYISTIFGVRFLLGNERKFINKKLISTYLCASALLATYLYGTLPGSLRPSLEVYERKVSESEKIEKILESIPESLSVAATNNLGSHLSQRENIYTFPNGANDADVIVFLLNDEYAQPSLSDQRTTAHELKYDERYIELASFGDFVAFAKKEKAGLIKIN